MRAYRADVADFVAWCHARGVQPRPAQAADLVAYVGDLARTRRPSTIRRRLAALAAWHCDAGLASPIDERVRVAVAGAEWRGRASRRETEPLGVPELRQMSNALPDSLAGTRDRAILLLGYGAALRRTELVALDVDDVRLRRDGVLTVVLRRGAVHVPPGSSRATCAVRAWSAWIQAARIDAGPAFRPIDRHGNLRPLRLSDRAVTLIVQRAAAASGFDTNRYTGRSLRRGMIIAAAAVGASDEGIMAQTGHRSRRLVRAYRTPG